MVHEREGVKMDKKSFEVVVFTNMGRTYLFTGVSDFEYTTQGFRFSYCGKSTGVFRTVEFNNTCVAGYAISEE